MTSPAPATAAAPPDLGQITDQLNNALSRVESLFEKTLRSELAPVQSLVEHIETYRGKMLRPMLVLLSGLAARPEQAEPTPEHVLISTVCEMIHMATLVHDDVLDEADIRRKGATVNRLHGNEAAVILGDYLFSSAYALCCTLPSPTPALLIGRTGMTLCSGELLQLHHRENFSIDEQTYYEIIRKKTASLIGVACRLGAMQSGADDELAGRFASFGENLGIAFQIQDDLLDLTGDQGVVGKPLRRDLELGKLTLPLIHHLASAEPRERGATLSLLDQARMGGVGGMSADSTASGQQAKGAGQAAIAALLRRLETTGSIHHARSVAESLVEDAKAALAPIPDSTAKRVLLLMADQVVTRAF